MTGAYAIRMLNTPDLQQPRASTWHYAAYSDDSSCETDDGGPPAVLPLAIQIGQSLNRSLSASTEIDWVGLTLP
jgi:hypothetical protein